MPRIDRLANPYVDCTVDVQVGRVGGEHVVDAVDAERNDHGFHVDGQTNRALLKRLETTILRACAFRCDPEHDSTLHFLSCVLEISHRRRRVGPIDRNELTCAQPRSEQRNPEQLLLGQHTNAAGERDEGQRDVVETAVVAHEHVSPAVAEFDFVWVVNVHSHFGQSQQGPGPAPK